MEIPSPLLYPPLAGLQSVLPSGLFQSHKGILITLLKSCLHPQYYAIIFRQKNIVDMINMHCGNLLFLWQHVWSGASIWSAPISAKTTIWLLWVILTNYEHKCVSFIYCYSDCAPPVSSTCQGKMMFWDKNIHRDISSWILNMTFMTSHKIFSVDTFSDSFLIFTLFHVFLYMHEGLGYVWTLHHSGAFSDLQINKYEHFPSYHTIHLFPDNVNSYITNWMEYWSCALLFNSITFFSPRTVQCQYSTILYSQSNFYISF